MNIDLYILNILCICSCIWDLEANKKTTDFEAHAGDVVSISLSPDGNTYVTGSVDKTCKLWDLREEKAKQTFFGHDADVNSVCVSVGRIFVRYLADLVRTLQYCVYITLLVSSLRTRFRDSVRGQNGETLGLQIRSAVGHLQAAELKSRVYILWLISERQIHILRQRRQFHSRMGYVEKPTQR